MDPDFHRKEMTLLGSRNATLEDFERVIAAIRDGSVPVERLITHRTDLARARSRKYRAGPQTRPDWSRPSSRLAERSRPVRQAMGGENLFRMPEACAGTLMFMATRPACNTRFTTSAL